MGRVLCRPWCDRYRVGTGAARSGRRGRVGVSRRSTVAVARWRRAAPRGSEGGQWFGPEGPVAVGDEPDSDVPIVQRGILLVEADAVDYLTADADQVGGCAIVGDGQLDLPGEVLQAGRLMSVDVGHQVAQPGSNGLVDGHIKHLPLVAGGSDPPAR